MQAAGHCIECQELGLAGQYAEHATAVMPQATAGAAAGIIVHMM